MSCQLATARCLFTIGHSDHEIEPFVDLLQRHGVTAVADVRSHPYSRYLPQFNRETLAGALQRGGIAYIFLGNELGARRTEPECYVDGQARYDRIARTPAFAEGLRQVRRELAEHRLALMCAEKDPLTCHRMILVCRALRSEPIDIVHILADGELESMDDAEARLLDVTGMPSRDLFRSRDELVDEAYERQAERIAYTDKKVVEIDHE